MWKWLFLFFCGRCYFVNATSPNKFAEHPLFSPQSSVCLADCRLSVTMCGNTWRYENLMRLFWQGHYSITVSAVWIRSHSLVERTCTTCETKKLTHVKWLFLPFEGGPKAWLFQGDFFPQQCAAATERVFFLKLLVRFWSVMSFQMCHCPSGTDIIQKFSLLNVSHSILNQCLMQEAKKKHHSISVSGSFTTMWSQSLSSVFK